MLTSAETGLPLKTFPVDPPFTLHEALRQLFWPGRPPDDRGCVAPAEGLASGT